MKILKLIFILLTLGNQLGLSQNQVSSNAHLFEFENIDDTLEISKAYFLNSYNAEGYNGQVLFLSQEKILLISNANPATSKTSEIISLDLFHQEYQRLTTNNRLETYPQYVQNKELSFVEYSNNGDSFLRLIDINDPENKVEAFQHLDNIYAATWLDSETVILNLKSDLNYMAVGYKSDDSFKIMEANVAARIVPIDESNFYYVHKLKADKWYLKTYDIDFLKKKTITEMPYKVEDFDVMDDGSYICGQGTKIFRFLVGRTNKWEEIFDLTSFGITEIQEVRVKGTSLLVVSK